MGKPPRETKEGDPALSALRESNGVEKRSADDDGEPPTEPNPVTSAAEVAAKVLRQTNSPHANADVQRAEGCRQIMKGYGEQVPQSHYLGDDGFETPAGVRMHPKMNHPSLNLDYLPDPKHPHLVKAYIGELQAGNRVQTYLPDDVVVHVGNPAGRQGPDVISVNPNNTVTMFESKYRTAERSIGPSSVPRRTEKSVEIEETQVIRSLNVAVEAGRLSSEAARKAFENYKQGTFDVCTVGTGNAHDGVLDTYRKGTRSRYRRKD